MIMAILTLLSFATMPAYADSSQCGFIQDSDQRAYCRATSGDGPSQCGFIQDSDLRAMCRAESGGGQSQCGFISDSDKRALCMAKSRGLNGVVSHQPWLSHP